MTESVSSAIAPSEDAHTHQSPPNANGLKRRTSDVLEQEQEIKRKRTSPGKNSPTRETGDDNGTWAKQETDSMSRPSQKEESKEIRRKGGIGDEKQRSKRLFGALLGNLNQPGDRVSKRRAEIEERRKAELQKQDDERLEDRQRRLEKLATQRKKEQVIVDEQNLQTRHKNLLNTANFFYTRTEPRLYYRPWDLLPDEEDRIEDQIKEAESQVDKEVAEWAEEKRKRLSELNEPDNKGADGDKVDGDEPETSDSRGDAAVAPRTQLKDHENGVESAIHAEAGDSTEQVDSPLPQAGDLESKTEPQVGEAEKTTDDQAANAHSSIASQELEDGSKDDVKEVVEGDLSIREAAGEAKEDAEDAESHVEEGDEDTVIY